MAPSGTRRDQIDALLDALSAKAAGLSVTARGGS